MATPLNKQTKLSRFKSLFGIGGAEGSWRGPFSGTGEFGGVYDLGSIEDGWQRNIEVDGASARGIPAAFACVMANARGISQCYATVKQRDSKGVITILTDVPAAKVLKKPNSYESWPQLILNLVTDMLFDGESFGIAIRNERGDIIALHRCPQKSATPYVADDGEIFYSIGANPMLPNQQDYLVPQRDIIHLRSYTPRHPLCGESAIKAAALAAGINVALSKSQAAFFTRMNRPSGVISTDMTLTQTQMESLRKAWENQSKSLAQGGIPILGGGMKFQSLGISSQDAQLIQAQRLSIEDIARVFGVPLPIIGDMSNATLSNVESMVNLWLSLSLGALLENIERSFDTLFDLPSNQFVELDTVALLRTDYSGRISALSTGLASGLFTHNEARAKEGLSPVANGDLPYMQSQMVELGYRPELQDQKPAVPTEEVTIEESKAVAMAAIKKVMKS